MNTPYPFKNQHKIHPAFADTVRTLVVEPKESKISMHPAWLVVIVVLSLTLGLVCGTKIASHSPHLTPKNSL